MRTWERKREVRESSVTSEIVEDSFRELCPSQREDEEVEEEGMRSPSFPLFPSPFVAVAEGEKDTDEGFEESLERFTMDEKREEEEAGRGREAPDDEESFVDSSTLRRKSRNLSMDPASERGREDQREFQNSGVESKHFFPHVPYIYIRAHSMHIPSTDRRGMTTSWIPDGIRAEF